MEIATVDQSEPTFADLLNRARDTVKRRWKVLALVTLGVFALCVVAIFMMTPRYEATARMRIDPTRDPVATQQSQVNAALSDEAIDTEVSQFYSLALARTVVEELDLLSDPEFKEVLAAAAPQNIGTPEDRANVIAAHLLDNLGVYREDQTYVLGIGYRSKDRIKAAEIANAFARNYIQKTVDSRTSVAESQAEWYKEQLANLDTEVRDADATAARFRIENGLAQGSSEQWNNGTIIDQQVAPLSGTLADAESFAAQARANYTAARRMARQGMAGGITEVVQSPTITALRSQRATVIEEKGRVTGLYGTKHPLSKLIQGRIDEIDREINAETSRILNSVGSVAIAASARSESLRQSLNNLETMRAQQTRASVIASSLDREADAKRALYDEMTKESLQSMQVANNGMASATIIDLARPPERPSSPNKPLFLGLALILALGAGIGSIATIEMLSGTVLKSSDVEDKLGMSLLAVVPKVNDMHPAGLLIERPTSFYAESLRIARGAVLGTGGIDEKLRVIAFTSAVPGEGKTTTSLGFARTLAVAGLKTLLVDCDVRRATMQQAAEMPHQGRGLVEYLSNQASLDDVTIESGLENLDMVLVREPHFASTNLFESGLLRQLIVAAKAKYDYVILDLPPLMGLADGRMLATYADALVLVVKWNDTPISLVQSAIDALRKTATEPFGVIVNAVDEKAEPLGGGYYQSRYTYYYQESKT
ncbi:MAG TPA: polysaccharide biosynthesis tyrosine autokinase [Novosphingobium sp.]|nr:polysaccharide biosynthesis tyrosine autokinase [Novosphingobium sp.]